MPDRETRTRAAVVAVFFLSGISGLVYQVVWVRRFGAVFGNTVHSAALVTSVFMGGLGAGAYVFGRAADRRYAGDPSHPLRVYARLELGIAALGLALAWILPRLGALSAATSSYATDARGWHVLSTASYAARYAAAIALVAPATFLMGGTLTLLIRWLVALELEAAAARIGVLYGLNTAGAAVGALLTDLALVPRLGLFATQLVAVAINATAGGLALLLARGARGLPALPAPSPRGSPGGRSAEPEAGATRVLALTGLAVALSGFAAMGLEIVWFRYLSSLLGAVRSVFSLLLAVLLAGLWLGSVAGGVAVRRLGRPRALFFATQALLAISALALLLGVDHQALHREHVAALRAASDAAGPAVRELFDLWGALRPVLVVVGLPALFMGAAFPIANANVQRAEAAVGGRAGLVYLANTAGSVLGSALAGFALLPAIGAQSTAIALGLVAVAAALPLHLSERTAEPRARRRADLAFAAALAAAAAPVAALWLAPRSILLAASLPADTEGGMLRVLAVHEGLNETLAVVEIPGFFRQLYTNGHSMTSNGPKAQRYMRAFAHVPLLQMDAPERALVICFGVGNTANAVSRHPSVKRLDVADLSRDVLAHAPWFAATNGSVLDDPRTRVFVNDGRHHLLMQPPGTYDLVTLEPPPLPFAGVASLYSREFYELVRARLRPGGYVTQWLPAYQVPGAVDLVLVRSFLDVFPEAVLLSGDDDELVLMGTTGPSIAMDLDAVTRRIAERPAVAADLERVDLGTMTDFVGMFAANARALAAATAGAQPMTDDRPVLEYLGRASPRERGMPASMFDVGGVEAWCPGCLSKVPRLGDVLRLHGAIYASESFLFRRRQWDLSALFAVPGAKAAVAASPYLSALLGGAGTPARREAERHLAEGRVDAAVDALAYAVSLDPNDARTFEALGRALLARGDRDRAAFALERAVTLDPKSAAARASFARALLALGERRGAIEQLREAVALAPADAAARAELDALDAAP
jgi:spermidine synthase